jgi:NitT/TauT family transport system substrate-binding protein
VVSRRTFLSSVSASAIGLSLAARDAATAQSAPFVVRLGVVPSFAAGAAFYAQDLGMFTKHGLDVQLQSFNNGATIAAATAGGSLDAGFSDVIGLGAAHLRGLPFEIIAPGFFNTPKAPGYAIIVKGDSAIKEAKDFNGKTIAINAIKSISQLVVQAWVDGNGGDSKTLKFIEFPFAQMVGGVQQGTVDASVPGEPFVTGAIDAGMRSLPLDKNALLNYMPAGYFSSRTWITANPDAAARFTAAIRDASNFANQRPSPPEAAEILAKYTKVPVAMVSRLRMTPEYGTTLMTAHVQPVIDTAAKYGILPKTFPASEILYLPNH